MIRGLRLAPIAVSLFLGLCTVAIAQVDVTAPGDPVVGLHNTIAGGANTVSANGGTGPFGPGMYPGGEAPPRAIDNITLVPPTNSSKYLNFGNGGNTPTSGANTGFYVTPAAGPSTVIGLRFATANDAPARDPFTFTLEGTNGDPASAAWSLIASGDTGLQTDPGRNTFQSLATIPVFTNTTAYSSYRLLFPTHRASANSMQIGEVEFLSVIPEPSTVALAGIGLLGLVFAVRRQRCRRAS